MPSHQISSSYQVGVVFRPIEGLTASLMLQGIYVLQDNMFRLLSQLSAGKQYLDQAPKVRGEQTPGGPSAVVVLYACEEGEPTRACLGLQYLAFTCGLVRGALLSLGVKSIVTAEVSIMPASETFCHFHHRN